MEITVEDIDVLLLNIDNKFNLNELSNKRKIQILDRNNILVSDKLELKSIVENIFVSEYLNNNMCLGIIPTKVIERITKEIKNIKSNKINELLIFNTKYSLTISGYEIKHMKKDSLTNNDILDFVDKIDKIITEFDEVSYSIYNNKQNALRFIKKINDITYITVIVISNRHQTFRVQTVYILKADFLKIQNKKESRSPSFNVQALNQTSETNGLTSFYEQILSYLSIICQ